jgi:hypothetical protein
MRTAAHVVALAALAAGCGINDPADFYLRVQVDGQVWNATSLPNVIPGDAVFISGARLDSVSGEQREFTLTLVPGNRPGTLTLRTPTVFGPPDRSSATYAEYKIEGPAFWETNDAIPGNAMLAVVNSDAGVIAGTFSAMIRPAVLGDVRPPDRRVTGSFRLRMETSN